jgi:hypothetical protein
LELREILDDCSLSMVAFGGSDRLVPFTLIPVSFSPSLLCKHLMFLNADWSFLVYAEFENPFLLSILSSFDRILSRYFCKSFYMVGRVFLAGLLHRSGSAISPNSALTFCSVNTLPRWAL